jgi:malate dehydrogenase
MKNAPTINANNFSALTRLDHNRAISQITERLNTQNAEDVKNVIIWGNHSATQYPDIDFAYIDNFGGNGTSVPVKGLVSDDKWVQSDFLKTVQQRVSVLFY